MLDHIAASTPGIEAAARQALRRNRAIATGLLLAMVLGAVLTHLIDGAPFWLRLLRAACEAGVVGGMADWFAVTALFRHPLGLPIPHTAILPRNKDRFGRMLGSFVEQNFLTPELLLGKLRQAGLAARFAGWLAAPQTRDMLAEQFVAALPQLIRALDNRDLRDFTARTLGEQLRAADMAPLAGRALRVLTQSGEADVLFERAAAIALESLQAHRGALDQLVLQRSRWWIPKAINLQIAASIAEGAAELLANLRRPDSDTRAKFRAALSGLIDELITSPAQRDKLNAAKNRLLDHPDVQHWLAAVWQQLSAAVLSDIDDPASKTKAAFAAAVGSVGAALATDKAMQAQIDRLLEALALQLVGWRAEIGRFIAEVIGGWDARTVSDRLELMIGSDLQYIRMNGTLVGAAVGCLLFLASAALG